MPGRSRSGSPVCNVSTTAGERPRRPRIDRKDTQMIKRFRGTEGLVVVLTFILFALAAPGYAQTPTLGDLARQEQERRSKASPPEKVYKNEDLKDGGLPSGPPPADAAAAGAGTSTGDAKPSTE